MEAIKTVSKTNKMPAEKKTVKKAAPTEVAAVSVPVTTPVTKSKKVAAKSEVTVPVVPSTSETPAAAVEVRSADAMLASLQDHLKAVTSDLTSRLREAVKEALEIAKAVKRESRDSKKRRRKNPEDMTPEEKKVWEARRANNAFLKLRPITPELASFMGLPTNSQSSQTTVTKFISTYVKAHNCFDPNFKRRIIPDQKLGKLLRVKDGQEVTYLNLQSFLKVHFIKPALPVAPAATTA